MNLESLVGIFKRGMQRAIIEATAVRAMACNPVR